MLVAMFSCIRLGLWQWHKAEQKQAITQALSSHSLVSLSTADLHDPLRLQALHLQQVTVTGHYLPQFTFLLDNQVEQGRAGFQVLTPFLLDDSTRTVVWVNRGWVAGFADHQKLPEISTSPATQTIQALFWQQGKTGFRLDKPAQGWQKVQQVIDFSYLRQQVPYTFPAVILKLDPAVAQDGFIRHWEVAGGQIEKHLSYAYQWFGFALASLFIGFYQMLEKRQSA